MWSGVCLRLLSGLLESLSCLRLLFNGYYCLALCLHSMCVAMHSMHGSNKFTGAGWRSPGACPAFSHRSTSTCTHVYYESSNRQLTARAANGASPAVPSADADFIVIGSGIGGLSCAAMLAKYGYKVWCMLCARLIWRLLRSANVLSMCGCQHGRFV